MDWRLLLLILIFILLLLQENGDNKPAFQLYQRGISRIALTAVEPDHWPDIDEVTAL